MTATVTFESYADGTGKYALLKNRDMRALTGDDASRAAEALSVLRELGLVDFGEKGSDREFFVVRLKDVFSAEPLASYAGNAWRSGQQAYGDEVMGLAMRAGANSPYAKTPD